VNDRLQAAMEPLAENEVRMPFGQVDRNTRAKEMGDGIFYRWDKSSEVNDRRSIQFDAAVARRTADSVASKPPESTYVHLADSMECFATHPQATASEADPPEHMTCALC